MCLPSHIGIKGNELADRLVNASAVTSGIDINIGVGLSQANNLVDKYIGLISKRQQFWDQGATDSHYRSIEKTISTQIKYLHLFGTKRSSQPGSIFENAL